MAFSTPERAREYYLAHNPQCCRACGGPRPKHATYCEPCSTARKHARKVVERREHVHRTNHRKRARHYGVPYEPINRTEVFNAGGWVCGICGQPIDPALSFPDPMAVSLDHIVPLAKGGGHVRGNVQPAHFICNSVKGDGGANL